jgi:hypothetical protein
MKKIIFSATIVILIICLTLPSAKVHAQKISYTSYVYIGVLLTPPSTAELGYASQYATLDKFRKMHPFNYGFGVQGLHGLSSNSAYKVGIDLSFGKLFNDTYTDDTGDALHKDWESSMKLLALVELSTDKRFLFQAGAGPNFVIWNWNYTYDGPYEYVHETDGGVRVNFELMTAGKTFVYKSDKISIPIILRVDCLFRYGVMLSTNIATGITF